ncbi:hypothetical protein [Tardiphaga sp.]|jgi:hypothetical protein|uniref:hypothetical protein n=1 Tax=Tardiphaga sp. TaxID=1926292 RepID=UPI0037DA7214
MKFSTTGHAAWILAAGLCVSAALFPATHAAAQEAAQAPEQPAAAVGSATGVTAAPAQPTRLHPKKTASKSRKAERQAKAKKPAQEETAKAEELKPTQDDTMSPAVANANAQWANEAKPTDTYNMSAQAGTVLSQMGAQPEPQATAADSAHAEQVVAPDQFNDLDRAAEEQPPLTLAKATIDTPPAAIPSATVENSKPWEQTSLIGKVFIALGGLLTLASAARMFIA